MAETLYFSVDEECQDERLDSFLSKQMGDMSRSSVQKLIEKGYALCGEKVLPKNYKVKLYDEISLFLPDPRVLEIMPENIPLDIPYEDSELLIVNKPKGMVVHPAPGNFEHTLVNALMYYCKGSLSGINGVIRPGIVHRIDKNTSGLLVVAKNDNAHTKLAEQIKQHSFTREYQCVLYGHTKEDEFTVTAPIGRHPLDRKKMTVTEKNSKNAITHFYKIEEYKDFTHFKVRLETGRTHQIRVHSAYIGHPVAGDDVYGPKKIITSLNGQCLHAGLLGFIHPTTEKYIELSSELPDYFKEFLEKLKY